MRNSRNIINFTILLWSFAFSQKIYDLDSEEVSYVIPWQENFLIEFKDSNPQLKHPFHISLHNHTKFPESTLSCEASNLSVFLFDEEDILFTFPNIISNPKLLYKHPYLFFIDDLMDRMYFKRLSSINGTKKFFNEETNSFPITTSKIPKDSLIRLYSAKSKSDVVFFINNYVYRIEVSEERPVLKTDDAYQISEVNLEEISDLIILDDGFLFLSLNNSILYYRENITQKEANLAQRIDNSDINLSDSLNITAFSYDYEKKVLTFSDYLNGVYFFSQNNDGLFQFQQRMNEGKVLQLDYLDDSLIIVKEIVLYNQNHSSIILKEYLEKDEKFFFNREVYLSSSHKIRNMARTSEFLALLEPNLIHLYRTSINSEHGKLKMNEYYREFRAENIIQIFQLFEHENNIDEQFFISLNKDSVNLLYPSVSPIAFNCKIPLALALLPKSKHATNFDVEIKYLNCPEKSNANDHSSNSYCKKKVYVTIDMDDAEPTAFLQSRHSSDLNSNKRIISIAIGIFIGLLIGFIIGIILKKKYTTLKIAYHALESKYNAQDMMMTKHSPKFEENIEKNQKN